MVSLDNWSDLPIWLRIVIAAFILEGLFMLVLGMSSLLRSIEQFYTYQVLNTPYLEFDPPLIGLGVLVFLLYTPVYLLLFVTAYGLYIQHRYGRYMAIILSPVYVWTFGILGIIPVMIILFVLFYDDKTISLFSDGEVAKMQAT